MEESVLYKLWLNILCQHEPGLINKFINKFGSAEEIFNSDKKYKNVLLGMKLSRRLSARRDLEQAKQLLEHCINNDISIISMGDENYPQRLAEVDNPPQILYVRGEMPDFDNLVSVAQVGSRKCSSHAREFSGDLAYDLASSGIIVVSGMAEGIDAAAHNGALSAGSKTVAVLAGGVDIVYPKINKNLYKKIIENGAVISERAPGEIGKPRYYQQRNRIIAGLSNGVVIVEGEASSGTKLTANWALKLNKDVFAVPGRPDDKGAELPNLLIRDGAKIITNAEDIIEEYISVYPTELKNGVDLKQKTENKRRSTVKPEKAKRERPNFEKYEETHRIILEYLYNNSEVVHIDDIVRNCDLNTSEVSFAIVELLIEKVICEYPGEYYSLDIKQEV